MSNRTYEQNPKPTFHVFLFVGSVRLEQNHNLTLVNAVAIQIIALRLRGGDGDGDGDGGGGGDEAFFGIRRVKE